MTILHAKPSPDALDHFARAIDKIMEASQPPPSELAKAINLSLCASAIAQQLCDAAHLEVGAEPRPLRALIPTQAQRFRDLAEHAIRQLDPNAVEDSREYAVRKTIAWLEGPGQLGGVAPELIAREALSFFLGHFLRPVTGGTR